MAPQYITAGDGLIARAQRSYAKAKLEFLDHFIPPALNATQTKLDRVYLDLFAGPGRNVDPITLEEFEGSPVRALQLRGTARGAPAFTRAVLCNLEPAEDQALHTRVERLGASKVPLPARIEYPLGDANLQLPRILTTVNPLAYLLVFADLEGIKDLPWTTVERLRARHASVDLYVLFPLEMSLNRLMGANSSHRAKHEKIMTAFFGCEDWRPIVADWSTDAQGTAKRDALERLYVRQLQRHWRFVQMVEVARFSGDRLLYRMMFATNNDAARRIASWTKRRPRDGQFDLELG